MKKIFTLLFMNFMLIGVTMAQKDLRILLVHDNNNTPVMTDSIRHAITAAGYNYSDYDAVENGAPPTDILTPYELVIWATGKALSTNFFDGELPNEGIKGYLDNGGMLFVEGIDFMYDGFGSASDTFMVGDFAYDYLGVEVYLAQSHYDDTVYDGVPMMVATENNGICTVDTVDWRWSTMWGADAIIPTDGAKSIYDMGPSDYDFTGKSCMVYNEKGEAKILSAFIRWDGFKTFDLGVSVTTEILDYFNKFSTGAGNDVTSIDITSDSGFTISENNGSLQLGLTVLPEEATNKTVTWSIAEGSVDALISQDGLLTASGYDNQNGKVYVVATANDGSEVADTAEVTISNQTVGDGYKVLLVNDNANGTDRYLVIEDALKAGNYNHKVFNAAVKGMAPDWELLSNFNFVIWYTGNDGVNLHFWDVSDSTNIQCNAALKQYADNGGTVWLQGIDFFYDIYGSQYSAKNAGGDSIITAFDAGSFVYDYLGIKEYVAQTHQNDGVFSDGVQQIDLTEENEITGIDPIKWVWSTMWNADVIDVTDNATPLYYMGPETYDFALYCAMVYNKKGESEFITSTFETGKIDTQENTNQFFKEVLDHFEELWTDVAIVPNEIKFNVYPNPATEMVNVELSFDKPEEVMIQMYDISGRMVYSKALTGIQGVQNTIIDVSNLSNGIYNLLVTSNNKRSNSRLVITK